MYLLDPLLSSRGTSSPFSTSSLTLPSSSMFSLLPCSLPSVLRAPFFAVSSRGYRPSTKLCTLVSSCGGYVGTPRLGGNWWNCLTSSL